MPTQARPANALQFRAEKNQFTIQNVDGKYAISLVGFSGKEFTHWWWGKCIFDRAGATVPFAKIPIDWSHDCYEGIGFLDTFGGDPEFAASGFLLPTDAPNDRAREIITKKEQGMPYQCSVMMGEQNFIEEFVSEGATAEVNGQTVAGPITIFRQYEIHSVAICLYGSDTNTTVFNQRNKKEGENSMSKETTPANTSSERVLAKKFAKKFGNARGFKYFSEGLTEEQATDTYVEEVVVELDEKDKRIAELETKNSELVALIAELEAALAAAQGSASTESTAASEETPVSSEEFAQLKSLLKNFTQAAGRAGGESKPLSAGAPAVDEKNFSPLQRNLRAFSARARAEAINAKRAAGK